MKYLSLSCVALLSVVLLGCGGDAKLDTVPVKGKLMVDGKPTGNCLITFSPIIDPSASGAASSKLLKAASASVGADGSFTLKTFAEADGAIPGKYAVSIGMDMATMKMEPVPITKPFEIEIKKPTDAKPVELQVELVSDGKVGTGAPLPK